MAWLESIWYRRTPPPALLKPLSFLYGAIADRVAAARKAQAVQLPVPVIVIGNIAIGGTGKTPFTIWLVEQLRELGWRPGVISRGYGGCAPVYPLRVGVATEPSICGDEPAQIVRSTGVPLAVAPDRVAAGQLLIESGDVDILVADDGLQHYRLARALEICVIDGARGLGNGARLPAGPLREPPMRLAQVSLIVANGGMRSPLPEGLPAPIAMQLELDEAQRLADGSVKPLATFAGQRVHAVAGIGNPARFFDALTERGLDVIAHSFPDHHHYAEIDLCFGDGLPVLMTEKDAVKCMHFTRPNLWSAPARVVMGATDTARVRELLSRLPRQ